MSSDIKIELQSARVIADGKEFGMCRLLRISNGLDPF